VVNNQKVKRRFLLRLVLSTSILEINKHYIYIIIAACYFNIIGCGSDSEPMDLNESANNTSGKLAITSSSMIDDFHKKCLDLGVASAMSQKDTCFADAETCENRYQALLVKLNNIWESRSGIYIAYLKQCIIVFSGAEYAYPSCVADFNVNMNYVVEDCSLVY